ncbi:MAG TPA: hypothetical protein VF281_00140 [Candidatus Saccharimonadales bacterium]
MNEVPWASFSFYYWIVLAGFPLTLFVGLKKLIKPNDSVVARPMGLLIVFGSTYPLSLGLKGLVIGPDWIRWHLGDFGFQFFLFLAIITVMRTSMHLNIGVNGMVLEHRERLLRFGISHYRKAFIIGLCMSVAYELFTGFAYARSGVANPLGAGSFDWFDVVVYALGAATGLAVIEWMKRLAKAEVSNIHELQALELTKRPAARQAQPKSYPKRKRHGKLAARGK